MILRPDDTRTCVIPKYICLVLQQQADALLKPGNCVKAVVDDQVEVNRFAANVT